MGVLFYTEKPCKVNIQRCLLYPECAFPFENPSEGPCTDSSDLQRLHQGDQMRDSNWEAETELKKPMKGQHTTHQHRDRAAHSSKPGSAVLYTTVVK